ncbi:rhomboid family intramembrane serine protease [Roseibium aestuarii]|uniref:Rhomboid family intramembrane serine protease n=1 Tax=Roseibium aestuarii TaxID=2600299 RepID=A0ABW4K023_9HYPH|nr:rhomboid family intramembrane serine protease [Roseibium aestuarii]
MFNLPGVVVGLCAVLIGVYLLQYHLLSPQDYVLSLFYFAFWPARYTSEVLAGGAAPGGFAADVWQFLSYGFLHGGLGHLVANLLWMVVFGSAVARRFGAVRFLLLSALCTVAGSLAHLLTHFGEGLPMVGASAAISGQMAAAIRFIFELGGPLGAMRRRDLGAYQVPAVPLRDSLTNRNVVGFIGVWFAMNLLFGFVSMPLAGEGSSVAWQAHIGGFLAGLLLFPLLDPVPPRKSRSV